MSPIVGIGSIGPMEWLLIGLLVLVIFGAKKLPQLGSGLGQGIKNFKEAIHEKDDKNLEADAGEKKEKN